ncbi:MAG: ligase-associated DNA damage response exonuclease [Hyphomonadaceae bacterium]|nr:ligase-associated DNA damage response exonuclease [Hyphomonadaceae bacterium]
MLRPDLLLTPTPAGLYCPPGDFYIDPVRKAVDRAVITHGHADHARAGHGKVLATPETLKIMAARYGEHFAGSMQAMPYGAHVEINGVRVSFAPAGHVLGSAQAIVDYRGLRMVCTGDFKRRHDPTCAPFEVVPGTHVFISEATFALPVFTHPDTDGEITKLLDSVKAFPERTHLVGVYSLGKAQRVIRLIRQAGYDAPLYIHGALEKLCTLYEAEGIALGELLPATLGKGKRGADPRFAGQIVLGPPSAFTDTWSRRFPDPLLAFASGWMRVRQRAKQRGVELPLIISDHADWRELTQTVEDVAPEELWVTHGREDALCRWAELRGQKARPLRLVGYEEEGD